MQRRNLVLGASLAIVLLAAGGYAARRQMGERSGASVAYGGSVDAKIVPELTSQDAARWVNGDPTTLAAHRGDPILIESWSPG